MCIRDRYIVDIRSLMTTLDATYFIRKNLVIVQLYRLVVHNVKDANIPTNYRQPQVRTDCEPSTNQILQEKKHYGRHFIWYFSHTETYRYEQNWGNMQ